MHVGSCGSASLVLGVTACKKTSYHFTFVKREGNYSVSCLSELLYALCYEPSLAVLAACRNLAL